MAQHPHPATPVAPPDEGAVVRLGESPEFTFTIVPRLELEPDQPSASVKEAMASPPNLRVEFPIVGKQVRPLPHAVRGLLTWVIEREGVPKPESSTMLEASVVPEPGRFKVLVDDKPPVIDLLKLRLFGKGQLGYHLKLDISHGPSLDKPKLVEFNNLLGVVQKPAAGETQHRLGSVVTFTPATAPAFRKLFLRLELHEGTGGKLNDETLLLDQAWKDGNRDPWPWAVGFSKDQHELLLRREADPAHVALSWRLLAWEADQPKTMQMVVENRTDFATIAKPEVVAFTVGQDPKETDNHVRAQGQISGFAPKASPVVQLAIVHKSQLGKLLPEVYPRAETRLGPEGKFELRMSPDSSATGEHKVDPAAVFALMRLKLTNEQASVSCVLKFDEDKYPGFSGSMMDMRPYAEWVCSHEATAESLQFGPRQQLDSDLVKQVLYKGGSLDAEAHEGLHDILSKGKVVHQGKCEASVCRAIERALVYLGYPTQANGAVGVTGNFGKGLNFGLALFLRHRMPELVRGKNSDRLSDKQLLFDSRDNAGTIKALDSFPTIELEKHALACLLTTVFGTPRTREVYQGDYKLALANLDRIDPLALQSAEEIVETYKEHAIEACDEVRDHRGVVIDPRWLLAIILQETGGVPRPKYEHHILSQYYQKKRDTPRPAVLEGERLLNIMECRYSSTSFGLCQVMGFNCSKLPGITSARDLFRANELDQVRFAAYFLADSPDKVKKIVAGFTIDSSVSLAPLAKHYNGGGDDNYAPSLHRHATKVKELWGDDA